MRPYLICASKRGTPIELREWLNIVIEAVGIHPLGLPMPKVAWRLRHSLGENSGEGPYRGSEIQLIQADFDVYFPNLSEEAVETWVLLLSASNPSNWQLELDEIRNGEVLMKAGRDFILVQQSLRTAFDNVSIYPHYINKILGSEFVKKGINGIDISEAGSHWD